MKHMRKAGRVLKCSFFVVALFALSAIASIFTLKHIHVGYRASTSSSKLAQKIPGTPEFSFAAAKAPGWHQGPTDKTSMALFSNNVQSGCWASIDRRPSITSEADELQKIQANWAESGYTVTEHDGAPISIPSNTDPIVFTLHQYTVTGKPGEQVLGGQEFAYFPFLDGSIRVQAYCNDAGQLATITPALQALSFKV